MRQLAAVSGESWCARGVSVAARFRRLPDDVSSIAPATNALRVMREGGPIADLRGAARPSLEDSVPSPRHGAHAIARPADESLDATA